MIIFLRLFFVYNQKIVVYILVGGQCIDVLMDDDQNLLQNNSYTTHSRSFLKN